MAGLDFDLVRHALAIARQRGFAEVDISNEGSAFRARLLPGPPPRVAKAPADVASVSNGESDFKLVKSPIVGFYRIGPNPLEVGRSIQKTEVVAVVNALGIANEVEAGVEGQVVEVLVEDGQAVQFGQVLARVKP